MDGQWESDDVERLVYELLRIEDQTKDQSWGIILNRWQNHESRLLQLSRILLPCFSMFLFGAEGDNHQGDIVFFCACQYLGFTRG